eukprot:747686-Pleurochrysis_carterae.AAC.1
MTRAKSRASEAKAGVQGEKKEFKAQRDEGRSERPGGLQGGENAEVCALGSSMRPIAEAMCVLRGASR